MTLPVFFVSPYPYHASREGSYLRDRRDPFNFELLADEVSRSISTPSKPRTNFLNNVRIHYPEYIAEGFSMTEFRYTLHHSRHRGVQEHNLVINQANKNFDSETDPVMPYFFIKI